MKLGNLQLSKKIIAFIVIILLCFENFAAVVSDNDGSAFITKAEFDSLKNNFQSKIDEYNRSIDSKIDSAIAAYLAGIKVGKTSTIKVIHSDWDDIEFINYEIKPDFKEPDYVWTVTAGWHTYYRNYDKKLAIVGGYKSFTRDWGENESNIRPLADIIFGNEEEFANNLGTYTKVAWGGVATRWIETWYFNKYGFGRCYNMTGNVRYRIYMEYPFTFNSSGYVANMQINSLLPIKPRFQDNNTMSGTSWYISPRDSSNARADLDYDNYEGYYSFNVVLGSLSDGITKNHDHIIVDSGSGTSFYLYNQNFVNTLNYCPYQTITDNNLGNVSGAKTVINGQRETFNTSASDSGGTYATSYTTEYIGDIAWGYDNKAIPMVGLLKRYFPASSIYQEKYDVNSSGNFNQRDILWDGASITNVAPLTLENGLETCISVKDKTYEWELEFDKVVLTGASGTKTNQNEVDIYLSKVPFGDGVSTSSKIELTVGTEKQDYVTTTDRKAKIKWSVDDNKTMVYMKCVPHYDSTDTGTESFLINLANDVSNQIIVTTKS